MQLTIYRGTKEIGGSCVGISTETTRIIIDVGLPLVDQDREPFDRDLMQGKSLEELVELRVIPRVPGLFVENETTNKPDAIVLSHAHLDHVGLLSHAPSDIPVFATSGTSKMMLAGSVFARQQAIDRKSYRELTPGESVQIGDIKVTPYSVDHSCFGAVALLVEAEGKKLLYSGDLRWHGRKPGMIKSLVEEVGPMKIDALVMEGTHFGTERPERKTEYQLEDEIVEHIQSSPTLVLASFSPIDVDRLVTYFKATLKSGRIFVADVYTAYVMYLVHREIKNFPDPRTADRMRVYYNQAFERRFIKKIDSLFQSNRIEKDDILELPRQNVMCFRPSNLRLDFDNCLPEESTVLYSYWHGYLSKPDWLSVQEHVAQIHGRFVPAHTSGHIYVEDIVKFVHGIGAKSVIPIHTFEPKKYSELFATSKNLGDGEPLTIRG